MLFTLNISQLNLDSNDCSCQCMFVMYLKTLHFVDIYNSIDYVPISKFGYYTTFIAPKIPINELKASYEPN